MLRGDTKVPTYSYTCVYKHESEEFFKSSKDMLEYIPCKHEGCTHVATRGITTTSNFILKGRGFYKAEKQ